MDGEILAARPDVEPFAFVENEAADLAAVTNPVRENRNVGDVLSRRNPLENRARPNDDPGEIVMTFVTISPGNVYHAVPFNGHVFAKMRLAQRQGNIVAGAVMLVDQRRHIDVRRKVAAIGNKQLSR